MKVLSQFCSNLRLEYVELIKHILRYISRTIDQGLAFDDGANMPDDVVGFIDSDFARSKPNQKLT